jgi:hypothetical protein
MSEKKVVAEHIMKKTLTEYLHTPSHDERTETREFRNAKKELENIEHLPCFKCGTHEKLESHHIFERSWGNGFDYRKVAFFLFNHFDFHGHCKRDFKSHEELLKFFMDHYNGQIVKDSYIDEETNEEIHYEYVMCDDDALDTIYNQWILCHTHHNTPEIGVHYIDGASFMSSLVVHDDFVNVMTEKEAKEWNRENKR